MDCGGRHKWCDLFAPCRTSINSQSSQDVRCSFVVAFNLLHSISKSSTHMRSITEIWQCHTRRQFLSEYINRKAQARQILISQIDSCTNNIRYEGAIASTQFRNDTSFWVENLTDWMTVERNKRVALTMITKNEEYWKWLGLCGGFLLCATERRAERVRTNNEYSQMRLKFREEKKLLKIRKTNNNRRCVLFLCFE